MRVLILGAGAVGGYFGARLAAADVDVTFLVRPARAAVLDRDGLVVQSPLGDLKLSVASVTQAQPGFSLILVACKAFDLNAAIAAIAPAVTEDAIVLPLLNGLRHLDTLDARFGRDRVLGGLCHIGVTLSDTGEILHLTAAQELTVGARSESQTGRSMQIHALLARGGFGVELSANIEQSMWEKFVLLSAYAAMTCLMRAAVGAIVAAAEGEALMREMLAECVAVARACGHAPEPKFIAATQAFLTEPGSQGTASMLRDIQRGARTEHEHILGDMLARARAAGVTTPLLRTATVHLRAYEFERSRRQR